MKYFLVTGAYGGMGRKTVEELKKQGYSVFAFDKIVGEPEDGVYPIEVDVTDEKSVLSAYEKVKSITESLYGIIHFAGVYMLDSLIEIPVERFDKIVDVNFKGAFLINRTFAPMLEERGRILHITSELATLDPLPFTGIYAITKAALDKYAYSLRMELQLNDVYVSVLRAGAVQTGMINASMQALDDFCTKTKSYSVNAAKFKSVVNKVEARSISAEKLSKKVVKIVNKRRPAFAYSINRNPLLKLLGILPKSMQLKIIKNIIK